MNKTLVYLTVLSSYISATIFSINLGFMQISLFRILVLFLPFACFSKLNSNYQIYGYLFSPDRKNNYSVLFMLFWLFYSLLSFLWSPSMVDSLRHSYFIACGVISVIAFTLIIDDVEDVYYCLLASTLMIFVHGIIGWREVFTGNYLIKAESNAFYAIEMLPVSSMHNVNDYATCMLIGFFLAFAIWKTSQNRMISVFGLITMISSGLIIIWSRSRANIYGLIIGIIFLLFISFKKILVNILLILFFLFLLVIFLNLYYPWITDSFVETILPGISGINLESGSDYTRLNLIKNGFYFLSQNLYMGTGAGGIEHWMSSEWKYDVCSITNIHNWWMEVLTGYGIFVFGGYMMFYFKLCFDTYKRYKITNNLIESHISLAMLGALVAFVLGSISSSSNMSTYHMWVFFAILIAYQGLDIKK